MSLDTRSDYSGFPSDTEDDFPLQAPTFHHKVSLSSVGHQQYKLGGSGHEECARQLAEAKMISTNLEKTVHWWADCTTKWREKWRKVNMEKTKARKEARQLKQRLELLTKELVELKMEKEEQLERKTSPNKKPLDSPENVEAVREAEVEKDCHLVPSVQQPSQKQVLNSGSTIKQNLHGEMAMQTACRERLDSQQQETETEERKNTFVEKFPRQDANKEQQTFADQTKQSSPLQAAMAQSFGRQEPVEDRYLIRHLRQQLEEAQRLLLQERQERVNLNRHLSNLNAEIRQWAQCYEALKNLQSVNSRQEVTTDVRKKELSESTRVKQHHQRKRVPNSGGLRK
ncbi:coiled-coil domain-containing protein 102A-like [Protopterus annectens]|uniref:coiled-coil domain-containing protein 102A-like n=1 Tax=Protopterus annectens TaxID=7888 RepID=UPI001CF9D62C|nr:coiled-coil domain-containing protein 102A-like [Protopterus annectens]